MAKLKVSVYIPCNNYGNYISQAIESVVGQSLSDWELIIIDDGSQDNTAAIVSTFIEKYPQKMRLITHEKPLGLQKSANEALDSARGEYIMRLDADDYLDESALFVLSDYLDRHPDVALVYPNFIYVDEYGNYLGIENRKRIGSESEVLDLPAHGACTLIRKRILKTLGGYDEAFDRQDGYELWLKVVNNYQVANVTTPLFFYRQHGSSLTQDEDKLLAARAKIKQTQVEQRPKGPLRPRTLGVILAKNTYDHLPNIVLTNLAGRALIDYTIDAAKQAELDEIIVTTDDPQVVDYCGNDFPDVIAVLRPDALLASRVRESALVAHAVGKAELAGNYPDIIVSLSIHAPLRRAQHIQEAIDTLSLYNVDSVVSVYEDRDLHYVHGKFGLEKINPAMHRRIRVEREGLYVENGAVRVVWRDILNEDDMFGQKLGHFVMSKRNSYQIKHAQDVWQIEQIIEQNKKLGRLLPKAWLEKEAS